mmetsp:Transcript_4011/g.11674  ORF Transcript_4011/g.11674 Transcript_4011/m.11674 type:complete len:307 (+) Transcript_4011:3262-4182(+)
MNMLGNPDVLYQDAHLVLGRVAVDDGAHGFGSFSTPCRALPAPRLGLWPLRKAGIGCVLLFLGPLKTPEVSLAQIVAVQLNVLPRARKSATAQVAIDVFLQRNGEETHPRIAILEPHVHLLVVALHEDVKHSLRPPRRGGEARRVHAEGLQVLPQFDVLTRARAACFLPVRHLLWCGGCGLLDFGLLDFFHLPWEPAIHPPDPDMAPKTHIAHDLLPLGPLRTLRDPAEMEASYHVHGNAECLLGLPLGLVSDSLGAAPRPRKAVFSIAEEASTPRQGIDAPFARVFIQQYPRIVQAQSLEPRGFL